MPDAATTQRSRRWDAIFLGSALPGFIAACQCAKAGLRVLLLEEEATSTAFQGLFEPFLLPGLAKEGLIHDCLDELQFPLIDRQQLKPNSIALQIILPHARLDVGEPATTQHEWVTWGYADASQAHQLAQAIARAGRAEREAMRSAPFVRTGRFRTTRKTTSSTAYPTPYARGLPSEVLEAPAALRSLLDLVVRATSNLDRDAPPPEAQARLLGALFEPSGTFRRPDQSFRALFRRRLQSLHGECRVLRKGFELVEINRLPGIAPRESREIWLGRALVLNTPIDRLSALLQKEGQLVPPMLKQQINSKPRVLLHWRVPKALLPEAMAKRLICVPETPKRRSDENAETAPFRIQVFPSPAGADTAELVASSAGSEPSDATIEATLAQLLPFSEGKLERQPIPEILWDVPDSLCDPPHGTGWPTQIRLRLSGHPPVYHLPRHDVASIGVEGDLLLGMRGGEALAAELT